jgi:hypothetical protein
MTSRRSFVLCALLLCPTIPGIGCAQDVRPRTDAAAEAPAAAPVEPPVAPAEPPAAAPVEVPATTPTETAPRKPVFIFMQSAKAVTFESGRLTLKGVGATTMYFADRPQRVTGHMSMRTFVPFWKDGRDTFLADPPHATLSLLGQGDDTDVVVQLRDPVLKGDDLSYSATVLQGDAPIRGGPASLFIDLVGVPDAALASGTERRTWHRRGHY